MFLAVFAIPIHCSSLYNRSEMNTKSVECKTELWFLLQRHGRRCLLALVGLWILIYLWKGVHSSPMNPPPDYGLAYAVSLANFCSNILLKSKWSYVSCNWCTNACLVLPKLHFKVRLCFPGFSLAMLIHWMSFCWHIHVHVYTLLTHFIFPLFCSQEDSR